MKVRNLDIKYICDGENFKQGIEVGYCGDTKTLKEWIDEFYNDKKREEMYHYCNDYIIEMIYFTFGKRLEKEQL